MDENNINDLISEVNKLIDTINGDNAATNARANKNITRLGKAAQNLSDKKKEAAALDASVKKIEDKIKWTESYAKTLQESIKVEEELMAAREEEIKYTSSQLKIAEQIYLQKQEELSKLKEQSDVLREVVQENISRITELPDIIASESEKIVKSLADERAAASRRISGLVYMNESYTSEISKINQELTRLRTINDKKSPSLQTMSRISELEDMKLMAEMYRERNNEQIDKEIDFKKYLQDPAVIQEYIDTGTLQLREELQTLIETVPFLKSAFEDVESQIATLGPDLDGLGDDIVRMMDMLNQAALGQQQSVGKLNGFNNTLSGLQNNLNALNGVANTQKTTQATTAKQLAAANKQLISAAQGFIYMMIDLSTRLRNVTNDIREIQQQLGVSAGTAIGVKIGNLYQAFESFFTDGAIVNQKQVQQSRMDFQSEFGGVLTAEAAADIARRSVEEGITSSQQATARRVFMTQTGGNVTQARGRESEFISTFEQSSLTSRDAMEAIGKYSELLARNGVRFSQSFAKAAADAKKIGVDLGKVDQIGDNIIGNFEGFLESQAELGAMGFNFDSFKIAQIAETGDTGMLFNELRSQLQGMGKDINNLRRSEQLSISEAFGISMSELQRLSGQTAGSGEKTLEDIQRDSHETLTKIFNGIEAVGTGIMNVFGGLGVTNTLLGIIARNTSGIGNLSSLIKGSPSATTGGAARAATAAGGSSVASVLKGGLKVAGASAGLGGLISGGIDYAQNGDINRAILKGLISAGGGLMGGLLGSFIGPMGTVAGGMMGSMAGDMLGDFILSDDMTAKSGYGDRMLVTPTATVALNNEDNVIAYADDMVASQAGITKYSKGELAPTPQINNQVDLSKLEAKMDQLVRTMSNMNVYIDSTKVGKILTNNNDVGTKVGIMGIQQTTAL